MDQLKRIFASLTLKQRISIAVAALAVGCGIYYFTYWNSERQFKDLYTRLSPADAGAVVQKLKEAGVEYRLTGGGTTVRVPADRADSILVEMASAQLPRSGRPGYESFDRPSFGSTDEEIRSKERWALEAELERSIRTLEPVESARVHISQPKDSVFMEARQEAKASVVISLRAGAKLPPQSVMGICHLVASAVPQLAAESVSVVDTQGRILHSPRKAGAEGGIEPPESSLEFRQKMERDLINKIGAALEPVLAPERFRAGASVECDMSLVEQTDETYDPSKSVMLTSQQTEDAAGNTLAAGAPGTAANLPRPPQRPNGGATGNSRKTQNTTYQASKTLRHIRVPQGVVKRISLSVLVDQNVRWEGTGAAAKRILEPPSPETLKKYRDQIAAATGLIPERGDQLIIESLPFESTLQIRPPGVPAAPAAPAAPPPQTIPLPAFLQKFTVGVNPVILLGSLLTALLLLAAGAFLGFRMVRQKKKKVTAAGFTALPSGGDGLSEIQQKIAQTAAERERLEAEAVAALRLGPAEAKSSEVMMKHLRQSAKENPQAMAQLLRTWIQESKR
jgi:flagellar M-ring protein FliF